MNKKTWGQRILNLMLAFTLAFSSVLVLTPAESAAAAGELSVSLYSPAGQPLNAYNLVVDSNATSPSTYAPSVATVAVRFCNTGDADLTNVWGYIGTFNGASSIPGTYPARNSVDFNTADEYGFTHPVLHNSGMYAFSHVGGAAGNTADASRYIGTLQPGECRVQYWHFTYPQCKNVWEDGAWVPESPPCSSVPTWGSSVKPEDDLWLRFNVWATADGNALGASSPNATGRMTMRNEISAMANKIEPNPNGAWFNTNTSVVRPGDVITSNGVLYSFGNINQGFDNDGDYVPDYNAWAQPLGDPSFDPTCFRLIRTTTLLTVSRSSGLPPLILNFTDQLYYTNLPSNNTGAIGEVRYTFLALSGPCSLPLTPYQEVASGRDNEKFNGDYGTGIPPVVSSAAEVTIDKSSAPDKIAAGGTVTYTIAFVNNGSSAAGLTLNSGWGMDMPLVISDTVPIGLEYVGGSAGATLNYTPSASPGYTTRFSTDKGTTWTSSLADGTTSTTANPIWIHWWLTDPLPAKPNSGPNTSSGSATFRARVPTSGYTGSPVVENKACGQFGTSAAPFACDTVTNLVTGNNTLGDFVWRDENNDGSQTGETANGINAIKVTLYYDVNGDGLLDSGDIVYDTQNSYTSGSAGYYRFEALPDGNYIVQVDRLDSDLPIGYRPTTPTFYAVSLDPTSTNPNPVNHPSADFGFGPSLSIEKRILGDMYEGREILYGISLTNNRPGSGTTVGSTCVYEFWAPTGSTANAPKSFTDYYKAFGKPDGDYAYGNFSIGANRWIRGTGFDVGRASGTFNKVEAIFPLYISANLPTNNYITTQLITGTTTVLATSSSFNHTYLNNTYLGVSNAKYAVWDITSVRTWNWNDFSRLTLLLAPDKSGGSAANSTIFLDAIGFRVTVNGVCPAIDTNDIMVTVPLTDTFDTTYLQFVSADPPHTTVNTSTGLITWNNVGPIYPGETKTVYVRFLSKNIGTSSVTVNNSTGSTGTKFADGGSANKVYDTATGTMTPTGSINGYVFSDPNNSGWNYSPGAGGDFPIPNVPVTIYGCYSTSTGDLITAPGNNNTCTGVTGGGEWRIRATTLTNASGYYEFNGLLNGFYYVQVTSSVLPGTVSQSAEANDNQSVTSGVANGHKCGEAGGTCDSIWGNPLGNLVQNPLIFNPIDSAGETINGVNFGYRINPGVYGSIWEDNNGNGSKNTGEDPIGSVTVRLYSTSDCTGSYVETTADATTGRYQFGDLTGGNTYCIAVDTSTLPGGSSAWTQTGETDGSINNRIIFTAEAGKLSGSHDFGFRKTDPYTIGDRLYYDWNANGSQQSNEEGIPNITVSLYEDTNGNGIVDIEDAFIMTRTTTITGFYQFTNLAASKYLVFVDTADPDFPQGVVQTQDPDEIGVVCSTCDNHAKVTITTASIDTIDFGYWPKGTGRIGDTVWRDMNGDGVKAGATETGIPNITVWLEVDLNNDGTYSRVMTTTTNSAGEYLFSNLPDGKYRVVVNSNDPDLPKDAFGYAYQPSTPTTTAQITISNGNTYLDADFGFKPLGAIGDTIYWDANANGEQDWNETGIGSGIVVTLTNTTIITLSNGTVYPIATYTLVTTTNASGQYFFTGLVSGTYKIKVGPITGNPMLTGDPDTNGIACYSPLNVNDPNYAFLNTWCDGETIVKVFPGTVFLGADFGYKPKGVIGDYVWLDADGDGIQDDNEVGIAGLVITATPNITQTINGIEYGPYRPLTTTTDFDGRYTFANLYDAKWTITVGNYEDGTPFSLTPTYTNTYLSLAHTTSISNGVGSMGGTSVDVTLTNGVVSGIDLNKDGTNDVTVCSGCNHDLKIDFGFKYDGPRTISGHVFFDAGNTGDGANDLYGGTGDVPYANVPVYLWYGGMVVGQTTTNASGAYTFTNVLAAAGYTVSVDRTGILSFMEITASPNAGKNFNTVDTTAGNVSNQDFGFYALMDMGDLPDSYNFGSGSLNTIYTTRFAYEGPMHINKSGFPRPTIYLGADWDAEADGQPDLNAGLGAAGGDRGDEDGINFLGIRWSPGITVTLRVTVTDTDPDYTPYLVGWFDWNQDGRFADKNETVLFGNLANGVHDLPLPIPTSAKLGRIFMRFRLYETKSPPPVISPVGAVINGEVEDYFRDNQPTAVDLVDFAAAPQGDAIRVTWETASEIDNLGFNLYRSQASNGPWTKINTWLIPPQFPGSVMGGEYEWLDTNVEPGVLYYYRLEDVETTGVRTFHGPVSAHLGSLRPTYTIFLPFVARQP